MNTNIPYPPRSPFTTRFSGTVRENKERIHNIFDGGRKRPGRWLSVLSALVTLFCCFYLVSCQRQESSPSLVMDTQYYDENGNYIEIPVLAQPEGEESTEGITAINEALSELRAISPCWQVRLRMLAWQAAKTSVSSILRRQSAISIFFSSGIPIIPI